MTASIVFVSDEQKAIVQTWCGEFRKRIAIAVEDRTVKTSFGRTHALVAGPENGKPLVVLHGALASSAHVLPELGSLVSKRRVYALDIIGQSVLSEDRRIDVHDDSYGRWVVEATDALGLRHYDLYGVSWGGFVALRAAQAAPARVGRLALLNPAGWVANSAWKGLKAMGWPLLMFRLFPSEQRLRRVIEPLFSTVDDTDWTRYFGDALRAYRLDVRVPPLVKPEELEGLTCPVLVFASDEDISFPGRALLARVRELLPHAEVELLEHTKHCPPTTDAFRTSSSARVERFLAS
ncbi:alpha/beta hydrolase [Pendulispora brunnea]|uniref:Alpha/beta hydrolase n=1 Tax=Pendulispora brunnea TaxID=2905690 RepID=A0ABZ2KCE4_9BACT